MSCEDGLDGDGRSLTGMKVPAEAKVTLFDFGFSNFRSLKSLSATLRIMLYAAMDTYTLCLLIN